MTLYARYTDIPGLFDVFTATLEPVASELTRGQLDHLARQRGEQVEIVPPPGAETTKSPNAGAEGE